MSAFSIMLERHQGAPTCTLYWVGKMLGHRGGDATLVDFVQLLVNKAGFPKPLPHRKHGGGLEVDVAQRSEWLRAGVEAWLGDYLPPDAAAMLCAEDLEDAAADMDDAADRLCGLRLVAGTESREVA